MEEEGEGNAQFAGYRGVGRFSAPHGETLLLLPGNTNCIKQGNRKRAQGCCPWNPSQEGARDQSAGACRPSEKSGRREIPSCGGAEARTARFVRCTKALNSSSLYCTPGARPVIVGARNLFSLSLSRSLSFSLSLSLSLSLARSLSLSRSLSLARARAFSPSLSLSWLSLSVSIDRYRHCYSKSILTVFRREFKSLYCSRSLAFRGVKPRTSSS